MTAMQPDASANENAVAALAQERKGRIQPVLIAGGGIGGLAAAIALARRGIASHVLERRTVFDEEGAGIQIGPNGTRILQRLGVAEALRPHVGVPEIIRVSDGSNGLDIALLPLGRWIAERYGAPYWVAHRSDLHAVLLHAARSEPLVALSMGFEVTEIATEPDTVAVAAQSGEAWTGKALIAADGVWSTVRGQQFSSPQPCFAGKSASRTVLMLELLPPEFRTPETGIWLFPDAHVVHYPVSAGGELAVVVILKDEHDDQDWSAPVHPGWVQQRLPTCAEPLRELITLARTWKRWALHTLPVPQTWVRGPIALLGDAAHPILPFLAQGGVLALEDAAVLADAMQRFADDVPAALQSYEQRRRARAQRVASASRRNGRIYHLSGPLAAARNLAMRMAPPEFLMARYDWLFGWRAD